MDIPVWVTVIICRLLGGFITGFLGVAVLAGLLITNPVGTTAPQSALVTYSLVVTVVSAAVIGLVMTGLLPRYDLASRARHTSLDDPPEP
jgi:hypothetical protein